MNQCILMAKVTQPAQTRYIPDQTPIAEAQAQYPGLRPEDPAGTLKIVGWGNMAQEVQERCQPGASLILEGRLRMNTVDRPEGFKEKQVELSVSKIHAMSSSGQQYAPIGQPAPTPAQATPRVSSSRRAPAPPSAPAPVMADAGLGGAVAQPVDEFEGLPF